MRLLWYFLGSLQEGKSMNEEKVQAIVFTALFVVRVLDSSTPAELEENEEFESDLDLLDSLLAEAEYEEYSAAVHELSKRDAGIASWLESKYAIIQQRLCDCDNWFVTEEGRLHRKYADCVVIGE